jgi:hypothetical protein
MSPNIGETHTHFMRVPPLRASAARCRRANSEPGSHRRWREQRLQRVRHLGAFEPPEPAGGPVSGCTEGVAGEAIAERQGRARVATGEKPGLVQDPGQRVPTWLPRWQRRRGVTGQSSTTTRTPWSWW